MAVVVRPNPKSSATSGHPRDVASPPADLPIREFGLGCRHKPGALRTQQRPEPLSTTRGVAGKMAGATKNLPVFGRLPKTGRQVELRTSRANARPLLAHQ